jgi:predicted small lipoprotein YifL
MRRPVKYTVVLLPLFLFASCGPRGPKVSDPLAPDRVVSALQQAFQSADASTHGDVNRVIDEIQQKQLAAAFADVKTLGSQPNITEPQRIAAIRAGITLGQELQDAAQQGDAQAAQVIHSYNASH